MTKHSKFLAALLTLLFLLSACAAFTVYAESDGGNSGAGSSFDDRGQDNDDGGSADDGGSGGRQQDYDDDSGDSGHQHDYDDSYDDDSSYSSGNQSGRSSSYDYDDSYDYEGERSASGEILYVGGDQTYVPPETIPSTTAALYDTSNTKVDENTLTGSDWADIKKRLTASNNTNTDNNTGDFAFIQENTSIDDNGHWMLFLGFSLMCLGVIGFIFLILKSRERKKAVASATYRGNTPAERSRGKSNLRYQDESPYGDVSDDKPSKGGAHFR